MTDACLPDLLLNADYLKDIGHWATSSTQYAACSVEPGNAEDVGKIVSPYTHAHAEQAFDTQRHLAAPDFGPDEHLLRGTCFSLGTGRHSFAPTSDTT